MKIRWIKFYDSSGLLFSNKKYLYKIYKIKNYFSQFKHVWLQPCLTLIYNSVRLQQCVTWHMWHYFSLTKTWSLWRKSSANPVALFSKIYHIQSCWMFNFPNINNCIVCTVFECVLYLHAYWVMYCIRICTVFECEQ